MIDSNDNAKTVLQLADQIVSQERIDDYGHPKDNFADIATMWSVYLSDRLKEPIKARDIAMLMILLKVCRNKHKHKRDNLVDIAGFAKASDMVEQHNKLNVDNDVADIIRSMDLYGANGEWYAHYSQRHG